MLFWLYNQLDRRRRTHRNPWLLVFYTDVHKTHKENSQEGALLPSSSYLASAPPCPRALSFASLQHFPPSRNTELDLFLHFPGKAYSRPAPRNLVLCLYWEVGLLQGTVHLTQAHLFFTTGTLEGITQQMYFHQSFGHKTWEDVPLHILQDKGPPKAADARPPKGTCALAPGLAGHVTSSKAQRPSPD